jgi:hypothetical protein
MVSPYHEIPNGNGLFEGAGCSPLYIHSEDWIVCDGISFERYGYSHVSIAFYNTEFSKTEEKTNFNYRASHSQILVKLPEYLRENGYKNPSDFNSGPFQFAFNFNGTYFDWINSIPEQQEAFNRFMAITRLERGEEWFDFFPTEERFGSTDPNAPLLVDIGGGLGHDLAAFHSRFPSLPGRLILQDLPQVINNINELSPSIERNIHDFFKPQPIKGARAYYLRTVLHDFPDMQALQILKGVREAMTSESVLLINENFLPEKDVPLFNAEVDLSVMAMFSSLERTQKQWIALLEEAGLEVVKVWTPKVQSVASGTLFEAVRKD